MTKINGLTKRGGTYHLRRRVPKRYQFIENKKEISRSLHTDSLSEATQKLPETWAGLMAGWEAGIASSTLDSRKRFEAANRIAKLKNVKNLDMSQVLHLPDHEVYARISKIGTRDGEPNQMEAEALLGAVPIPGMKVSEALEEFWELTKDKRLNKSPNQVRAWLGPFKKAVSNFIKVVGDKPIDKITRDDMLQFRAWWLDRIENEDLNPGTANKDFINLGSVLKKVNNLKNMGLDLPIYGLNFAEGKKKTRPQFSEEWIKTKLLDDGALDGLGKEARSIFLAMINTGARPSELANLLPEHIFIDHEYPHISITADGRKNKRELKSANSERLIPLVGVSLEAMRTCPDGFPKYRDKSASLSNAVNRYLTDNGLKETPEHSVYSLRHSFEERLRKANVDVRLRAELFGHSHRGERYGAPKIDELTDVLRQIAL